jgi:hypothetical protein
VLAYDVDLSAAVVETARSFAADAELAGPELRGRRESFESVTVCPMNCPDFPDFGYSYFRGRPASEVTETGGAGVASVTN